MESAEMHLYFHSWLLPWQEPAWGFIASSLDKIHLVILSSSYSLQSYKIAQLKIITRLYRGRKTQKDVSHYTPYSIEKDTQ